MFVISCPHCGPRADLEFSYARAFEAVGAHADVAIMYARANPAGLAEELWQHTRGCRAWLVITRHRTTHAILAIRPSPRDTP
jgi:sarcosine oxidase subunit delta